MKNLKEKLLSNPPILGSWVNTCSPVVAELMAMTGFDFLCVDVEHSAVDLPQVQQIFQAITSGNPECAPLVRLHGIDYSLVKRYLDAGARGVVAPLVRTREDVMTLVNATKYPPTGLRGVGFCRANNYGMRLSDECEKANDEILLVLQIEHIEAVDNIDDILSVPGVDAVFIGPYDLSASMGITGDFQHPNYIKARERILEACQRHNVAAGIHVVPTEPEQVVQRHNDGYEFIAYSLDITMLTTHCQEALKTIRSSLSNK